MSYIPNCREKYHKNAGPFPHIRENDIPENEINPYWYRLLKDEDAEFLRGYDYNTIHAVNNLFDNLDVYQDKLAEIGINVNDVDVNIINGAAGEINSTFSEQDSRPVKWYEEYSKTELGNMNSSTKAMLVIKSILNDYIEKTRDEVVTSMIESMDDRVHTEQLEMFQNMEKQA